MEQNRRKTTVFPVPSHKLKKDKLTKPVKNKTLFLTEYIF